MQYLPSFRSSLVTVDLRALTICHLAFDLPSAAFIRPFALSGRLVVWFVAVFRFNAVT